MAYKKKKRIYDQTSIAEMVRKSELDYRSGDTTLSKYVKRSMSETIDRIDAYHFSRHITGDKDSLGRDKPFPNIVVSAENIWFRATDIDRSNIRIKARKEKDVINAFLKNVLVQNWMREENFGLFLNEWGRALARYGSAIVKFVDKGSKLERIVVPWQRIIVDPVDFENNIKIEILELTEAQLWANDLYDKEVIEKLCDAKETRKTLDGQEKDSKSEYIRLFEVHGKLPLSYLTDDEEDEDTFVDQMHVISYTIGKHQNEYNDFTLYRGREKDPYMLTHLIKEEGCTLSIGPVEALFDTQWMVSHSAKSIKDQLDLASKLIFQTSDETFIGQNALTAIETGDILIHKTGQPLTQVANNSHDITSLQNQANFYKSIGNEITGVSEAMLGKAAVSGTAWRQVEALLNESHDLFETMRQNKGLYLEEMFRKFIFPYINRKIDTSEEISSVLESYDIERIDARYLKNKAIEIVNKLAIDTILNGEEFTPEMQQVATDYIQNGIKDTLSTYGNQRFFKPSDISTKTWKELFKDSDTDIEIDVTGEATDKDAMTTLNTLLMYIVKKQGQPFTPEEKLIFNKVLMLSGVVNPIELEALPKPNSQVIPVENMNRMTAGQTQSNPNPLEVNNQQRSMAQ